MKVLIPVGKSKDILATIAIGGQYYDDWLKNAYPSWKRYCKRHDLGLIVFDDDLISKSDKVWKKATWQKMLIASTLKSLLKDVNNVCYLDTDILINDHAPNIFLEYDSETIGLVSQVKNVPFEVDMTHRKISFLRHTHYDNKYPLDSAIFMPIKDLFKYHKVDVQDNYACMGLIMFNVRNHAEIMHGWFNKYNSNIDSITGGGDEPYINYEIQNYGKITWLDYKFQALWTYEMAIHYPFLFNYGKDNITLIRECIEASLMTNYFLHFAGSWHESDMWKLGGIFEGKKKKSEIEDFYEYLDTPVKGDSKGTIKPS